MRHAPADLQLFRVTQLPDQPSRPGGRPAPPGRIEAFCAIRLFRVLAAPAPGLPDIEDERIVNPFIAKPRDRDIGILSLEVSAGPGSKKLGRGRVISHKQVDTRTTRNCCSTACPQLFDGSKPSKPASRSVPADLQLFRVTQLPDQPSAPVTDWRALAEPEHLRDPLLQCSTAPATSPSPCVARLKCQHGVEWLLAGGRPATDDELGGDHA